MRAELTSRDEGSWQVTIHNDGPVPVWVNADGGLVAVDSDGRMLTSPFSGKLSLTGFEIKPGKSDSRPTSLDYLDPGPWPVIPEKREFILRPARYWLVGWYMATDRKTAGVITTNLQLGELTEAGVVRAIATPPA